MAEEEQIALNTGKEFGISEAMTIYTSKVDIKEFVLLKAGLGHQTGHSTDRARRLFSEYKRAIIVGGEGAKHKEVSEGMLKIEQQLLGKGFYKSVAITPFKVAERPTIDEMGIDIFSTVKRYKKNLAPPKGEAPGYGIILLD